MNMLARFDENPAMILQDIKENVTDGHKHGWTDNVKTVYPPQTKFAGGIKRSDCSTFLPAVQVEQEIQVTVHMKVVPLALVPNTRDWEY